MQTQPVYYTPAPQNGVIVLDEEWQRQTEISERRKAQNRLAQRNFRKRRSQQQQLKQQQESPQHTQDSTSKGSYPSPQPSPQTETRAVKSLDQDSSSRTPASQGRKGSVSKASRPSTSSSNKSVNSQSMLPGNFLTVDEESMPSPQYGPGNVGGVGPGLTGHYPGQYGNGMAAGMNQPMAFEAGLYEPHFPTPMYAHSIRPAIIPRTQHLGSADSSMQPSTGFGGTRRASAAGMSIDLGHARVKDESMNLPVDVMGSVPPQGFSPGLNSSPAGQMSLHLSAEKGHEGVVRLLLDCGADPDARDDYGSTALHLAAKNGNEGVVQALLDKGADVNAKSGNGWTAVHIASKYGHENILRLLIHRGADLNAKATDSSSRKSSIAR